MLEDIPMLINDDDEYSIMKNIKLDTDDLNIISIDYTEYVPGGK